ncbi:hypothetical protein D7Y09_13005 [bacterium 1XD42-1]|nr:hypothetical protein D7X25_12770 [bacterium 1XD42-8]RKJ62764.1 hypothetical protein D7Y09_13005 [bacterium 1XD42-1]
MNIAPKNEKIMNSLKKLCKKGVFFLWILEKYYMVCYNNSKPRCKELCSKREKLKTEVDNSGKEICLHVFRRQ